MTAYSRESGHVPGSGDALRLRPGPHRAAHGHPWVFAGELETLPPPEQKTAALYDQRGRFLGRGMVNPQSQIVWRRYSGDDLPFDDGLVRDRLERAFRIRRAAGFGHVCRLFWSESDGIPGLVVDRYGEILVIQALTRLVDACLEGISGILVELLAPRCILARNDAQVREYEGLPRTTAVLYGALRPDESILLDGMRFAFDPLHGQKTGLYLDQKEQYGRVAAFSGGRRVLDAFCNQGAFGLFAARAGAREVTAVDSSQQAIDLVSANAAANGLLQITPVACNVFDFFREQRSERWDCIILDPPPFAPSKRQLAGAVRGYKELNLRAAHALTPGGILASYSCSHHVDHDTFSAILREALADAGRTARLVEYCHQPADHPVILGMPESEYLRGMILQLD